MKPSSGARRLLAAAIACIILFGAAGLFVLPPIIRTQAEKRLSAELDRTVSIGRVRVNPFVLSLSLEDLDIRERDGSGSFLGWRRLYVRFDAFASLGGDWVLGAIELDGFHASAVASPSGSFNFSDLLSKLPLPSANPAKPGRPIRVGRLSVSDSRVDFSDRSLKRPFATQVGPLAFTLTDFRTVGSSGAAYHFEAVTEAGERVAWNGTLSADPLESRGDFEVENLVLKKYTPYFEGLTQAELADGKLTASGRYAVDFDPGNRVIALGDCEIHLRALKVLERATGKLAAEVDALDVIGLQANAVAMRVAVDRIALTGGHLAVRREKDGSVNLPALLNPAGPERTAAGAGARPAAAGPPQFAVGEISVKDSVVDIYDEALPHAAQLSLASLQASLKNFTLIDGGAMPVHLSFDWVPKGTVQLDGTIALKPTLEADLTANVVGLDVLPLSPYLEHGVNARITQGAVSAAGSLHASMSGDKMDGTWEGDVSVDKLGLLDAAQGRPLAGFSRLSLKGLNVETGPKLAIAIGLVGIVDPYARVRIEADKSLNISSLMGHAGSPAVSSPLVAAAAAPRIEVGRVVIDGGDFSFTDQSIEPNVNASLSEFGGTISGLSTENLARAGVDLKAKVDGVGPVEITGKLDPLGAHKYVGLKIEVTDVDLLFLSPYMGKYAGYELTRGQLKVDSSILVDGDAVDSTNVVTLRQFTFGSATTSPNATALPVRLGVALLKDADGRIVIDLPVKGSLGNPDFRIGKVVLRVIVNLLTKAAVSPFSLIGSMFGGGGDELAFQEFAPGSSDPLPSELPKLATIAKALENRPALSLGLEGGYDEAADTYALKRSKLAALLRRGIWEERHEASPNIPGPDELVISPEENAAMLKKLFDAKFPPGTPFGTPLPPPPVVTAPPAAPRPGLLRRFMDIFKAREEEEERLAAQKEAARIAALHEESVAKAIATGLPPDQMTGRLEESMEVTNNDLAALASARAQHVRNRLIESGHIAADRLFLAQSSDPTRRTKGPRVVLDLE